MEKIFTQPKMSKISLDCMFFEIILSSKGNGFRARSSSMAKIANIKEARPEATSKYSYENAIQKLIPKIENALVGTEKQLGKVTQDENGKIIYTVENIIYQKEPLTSQTNNSLNFILSAFMETFKTISSLSANTDSIQNLSDIMTNNKPSIAQNKEPIITVSKKSIPFKDVIIEWLQHLLRRTKKSYEDEDYLSPTTLESYNRNLWDYVFPYLEEHPEYDDILIFSETHVDEILNLTKCKDTQRVLLLSLRLVFEFAKEKRYITNNPIADKKLKKKKQVKKDDNNYDFIEEEHRALWINCMLKEHNSKEFEKTDAPLAFLFALLHGTRPEETCGTRWIDLNFSDNDFHVQNAFKKIPIHDNVTMKRIGWEKGDGPLKTPESYRHIPIDLLIKELLLEHQKKQKAKFKKIGKRWNEKEYVFLNSTCTPFTPDILSKNFTKFVRRNNLSHLVVYGLRHSFATHCRNLGMSSEVLARLMGHTEYETTQKYYIHVSSKQKKDELQKIQQQDIKNYLGESNKELTHLQNNINKYNKQFSNLQEIQKDDMTTYLQINDETLSILKGFIQKVSETTQIIA